MLSMSYHDRMNNTCNVSDKLIGRYTFHLTTNTVDTLKTRHFYSDMQKVVSLKGCINASLKVRFKIIFKQFVCH